MTMSASDVVLSTGGKDLTLPVVAASQGTDGYNISTLLKDSGAVTYDAGFVNTAACKSAITFIDGDVGILRYRGYPIEQLAEKSSYVEVAFLLIYGELPTPSQLADFDSRTVSWVAVRSKRCSGESCRSISSTNGAIFGHPHARCVELLLKTHGAPGKPCLHFNYLVPTTEAWRSKADQTARRYQAFHPKGLSLVF